MCILLEERLDYKTGVARASMRAAGVQSLPGKTGALGTERHEAALLDFRDVHRPTVGAAEAQVARLLAKHVDFVQKVASGREHDDGSLAVPRHVEISVDVEAHAV